MKATKLYNFTKEQISHQITAFQERYGNKYTITSRGVVLKSDIEKTDTATHFSIRNVIHALFTIPKIRHCQKGKYPKSSYCIQFSVNEIMNQALDSSDINEHFYITNGELIVAMMILGYKYEYNANVNTNEDIQFMCNCAGTFESDIISDSYEENVFKYKEMLLDEDIDRDSMTIVRSFLFV